MSRKATAAVGALVTGAAYIAIVYLLFFAFWPRAIQPCDCGVHPTICLAIPAVTLAALWLWNLTAQRTAGER